MNSHDKGSVGFHGPGFFPYSPTVFPKSHLIHSEHAFGVEATLRFPVLQSRKLHKLSFREVKKQPGLESKWMAMPRRCRPACSAFPRTGSEQRLEEEPPLRASLGDTSFQSSDPRAETAPAQSKPERAEAGRWTALLFLLLKYLTKNWPKILDRTRSSTFRGCWLPRGNETHSQQGRPILERNETNQSTSEGFLTSLRKEFLKLVPLGSPKMRKADSRMDKEAVFKNQARCPEMEVESCEFALCSCWKRNFTLFKA